MELVMCRGCGEFVEAATRGDDIRPLRDECPSCGGGEFKHVESGTTISTGEDSE